MDEKMTIRIKMRTEASTIIWHEDIVAITLDKYLVLFKKGGMGRADYPAKLVESCESI